LKFTVLTLFPNLFKNFINESIIKRAITSKKVIVEVVNFRDFSLNPKKKVDDYQYGGGGGMVIKLQPIISAIKKYKKKNSKVILLSPQGKTFNNVIANRLIKNKHIILICGHYEGFDERIINYVDEIISIGDYILTGGEIPAMAIMDTCIRLINNVINPKSLEIETFDNNLLDYPVYTKPIKYDNYTVPKVLLSGNHKLINDWRKKQQIMKTKKYRIDLYNKYTSSKKDR